MWVCACRWRSLYLQRHVWVGQFGPHVWWFARPDALRPFNSVLYRAHCMYYNQVSGTASNIRRTRPARAKSHQKLAGGQNRNTAALSCQFIPKTISSIDVATHRSTGYYVWIQGWGVLVRQANISNSHHKGRFHILVSRHCDILLIYKILCLRSLDMTAFLEINKLPESYNSSNISSIVFA